MFEKKRIRPFTIALVLLVVSLASLISIPVNIEKMIRRTKATDETSMTQLSLCGTLAVSQATYMPLVEEYRQNQETQIALLETQVAMKPFTTEWSLRVIDHEIKVNKATYPAPLITLCFFRECLDQYSFTESIKWVFDPGLEGDFERVFNMIRDYVKSAYPEIHSVNLIIIDAYGEVDNIMLFDL